MSLPDLVKDVNSANNPRRYPMESCKPKSLINMSATIRSRSREDSSSPDFEWETDSLSSVDEGEAAWDALGRMNSIRRSNRFDKPQLLTVQIQRSSDGFGLELRGKSPPTVHAVCKFCRHCTYSSVVALESQSLIRMLTSASVEPDIHSCIIN